jgi:hypothetical protein
MASTKLPIERIATTRLKEISLMPRSRLTASWSRFVVTLISALCLGSLALVAGCGGSDGGAPKLDDPTAVGSDLVNEYATLIQTKNAKALDDFVSDAFIIQRADGSSSEKEAYLQDFPDVGSFTISDVSALQAGDVLVVRWSISVEEVVNGTRLSSEPAPRLSTFAWEDGRWRLTSHANFAAPAQ